MEFRPLELLILQPTPFCNISCTYCYLPDRSDPRRMSPATVQAISTFLNGAEVRNTRLTVVWHAGEPLVVGPSFYTTAFQVLANGCPALSFRHSIQTNGMLITDAWCHLFREWQVEIGVSLDGPDSIHDQSRVDRSGRGTFASTMAGVETLHRNGIPFSVITVLTREAMSDPDGLWAFYQDLGPSSVAFNLEESDGAHTSRSLGDPDYERLFSRFIERIDDLADGQSNIVVRELVQFRSCLEAPPGSCVRKTDNVPGAIVTIDVDGNASTFSPELAGLKNPGFHDFQWGNVHTGCWASLASHPGFARAAAEIAAGILACRETCSYFPICGGGPPSNKLSELGTFAGTETAYCRVRIKSLTDVLLARAETKAETARKEGQGRHATNKQY